MQSIENMERDTICHSESGEMVMAGLLKVYPIDPWGSTVEIIRCNNRMDL